MRFRLPANLTTAVGDMQTAYTDAAGRRLPILPNWAPEISAGLTLAPGHLQMEHRSVSIPTDVTLNGGPNDVWIFQIAQRDYPGFSGAQVILTGGALPKNVFWQAFGVVATSERPRTWRE